MTHEVIKLCPFVANGVSLGDFVSGCRACWNAWRRAHMPFSKWVARHDRFQRAVLYCRQEGIEVTMP